MRSILLFLLGVPIPIITHFSAIADTAAETVPLGFAVASPLRP